MGWMSLQLRLLIGAGHFPVRSRTSSPMGVRDCGSAWESIGLGPGLSPLQPYSARRHPLQIVVDACRPLGPPRSRCPRRRGARRGVDPVGSGMPPAGVLAAWPVLRSSMSRRQRVAESGQSTGRLEWTRDSGGQSSLSRSECSSTRQVGVNQWPGRLASGAYLR